MTFITDMAAGLLLLVILLFFLPQPSLTGIPTLIRERHSVQMTVDTPPPVSVSHYPSTHSDPVSLRILGELQKPEININDESSDVISITCVLPESASDGSTCHLYTGDQPHPYKETQARRMRTSSSTQVICIFSVSKSDLFRGLKVRRDVSCDYRENIDSHSVSPRSDGYNFTVQKPLISSSHNEEKIFITCEIPGHAGNDTTCNLYVGDQSHRILKTKIWRKKSSSSNLWFCQFTVTEDDLIRHLQSVGSQKVSCDYRVSSGRNSLSPRSDGYIITNLLGDLMIIDPTTKQTSSTAGSTVSTISTVSTHKAPLRPTSSSTSPLTPTANSSGLTVSSTPTSDTRKSQTEELTSSLIPSTAVNTISGLSVSSTLTTGNPQISTKSQSFTESSVNSNHQDSLLVKLLWLAAVGVVSGLGLFLLGLTAVCLCRKTKKNYSQRSVQQDDHNQVVDLVMGDMRSGGMVDSGHDGFYSAVSSVPSTFLPSGPIAKNGEASENENSDIYHVYCSIPDRPATSAQTNGLYSLLQTH
ncbi:putative GPI-anchored protein pfl2 isoform X3 [Esox lucius]|uniref:putative GPI-anchored protein pfl2 isoform X3 n=1 Tax=Esox lucius TaxID=8010 RepID=UPI0014770835|nr:putative GPI-anchored protein pfl2 isoform X3 [Esox lucius]